MLKYGGERKVGVVTKIVLLNFKVSLLVAILGGTLTWASCGPKAPYSDIKTDRTGGLAGQGNRAGQSASTMPNTPATPIEPPAFFDPASGQIKDLPMYPGSKRETMQFGPISGYENLTTRFRTGANFDAVTKYFDQVATRMGWTVVANNRGTDNYSWQLSKGVDDLAQVSVAKGNGNNNVYITVSRSRKQAGPEPQASTKPQGDK